MLFCDLVGFTARSDHADPEDVRATLGPYHSLLRKGIERYGGTVEKFIGDAVMAVFGAPVAHEDDPERAVRAGLRILEAIQDLNESQGGLDLAVRVGINTGEAVVVLGARPERGEGIATGDVVNTAARLQTAAPIGSIAVGESTYRATRHLVDYEELAPAVAKGKLEPLALWRAVRAKSGFGVDVEQGTRTRLIGREAELGLLQETFTRTLRDAAPQLVTLTGEPGVGKTRLVWEFRNFVDERPEIVSWRQGRCLPYGEGIAFWALGEIVKAQAGIIESEEPEQVSAKILESIRSLTDSPEEVEWLRTRLAPLVGGEGTGVDTAARGESFAAWGRFFELVAARTPLVAVFEDLHWADPVLIEFLEHLMEWVSGVPMLVLCTGRPELYERHPRWGGGKRNSVTVALAPLGSDDTARLVSELLSQTILPAEVQATLIERSGGNPLYTEEFVKMLVDRGMLTRAEGGGWRLAPNTDVALPESLQALIAARLDTLPHEQKAFLQDGAVVGKVFWSGAVASMGGADQGVVREALHELVRKEFLRPARTSSMSGEAEYSFWHVLIRDVAYSQIPRAARGLKHRAAAEWIERKAGDRAIDQADFLVHHYAHAFELAQAAGAAEEAERLKDPLRRALVLAGDRAAPLDAAKAESFYRRALELLPPDDPSRPHVAVKALDAAWETGSMPVGELVIGFEQAAELFRRHGDAEAAAGVMLDMVNPLWVRGDTRRAEDLARRVVELLDGKPTPLLTRAYSILAGRLMLAGKLDESKDITDRALELDARLGPTAVTVRALQFRGSIRCLRGDPEGGLLDLREALDMGIARGLSLHAGTAYVNLADFTWDHEGPAQGMALFREGLEFSRARGMDRWAMWTKAEMTWLLYGTGDWDECLQVAEEVLEWDERFGGSQMSVIALGSKADVLVGRGRAQEAAALVAQALPRARAMADPQILIPALLTAGTVELALGRPGEAIEEIERVVHEGVGLIEAGYFLPGAVRILAGAGRLDAAQRCLDVSDVHMTRLQHGAVSAQAILEESRGDLEKGARLHAQAANRWTTYGYPFERSHSLLGWARCSIRLGRDREGAGALATAREILSGLGAVPLLGEASRLLADVEASGTT